MSLLLVTGLSGAGKSLAVNALEDIGFFCVDNIPSSLISKFIEFYRHGEDTLQKVAMVVDIRGNNSSDELRDVLKTIKENGVDCKILFLDANDNILERRYKETRRMHPISQKNSVSIDIALQQERDILSPLYTKADYIIDTSILSTAQLKDRVISLFTNGSATSMALNIMSFGFKYGLPKEADLVFDVRCLPNPYYIPELKEKTGLDKDVDDYVFNYEQSTKLLKLQWQLLEFSLPLYVKEGKSQLTIAVGCTGGKHRSIAFAERLATMCTSLGYKPQIMHRDIKRFN
ncbi:MAG: RNase adapter RapZ [Oscillospiraceae bacterium]